MNTVIHVSSNIGVVFLAFESHYILQFVLNLSSLEI